ncbi:MAG: hypothetical protein AAGB48_11430 [Planctomycetota bacterium]
MSSRFLTVCIWVLLSIVAASSVVAQTASADLVRQGDEAYKAGQYELALSLFRAAEQQVRADGDTPDPLIHFRVLQAAVEVGDAAAWEASYAMLIEISPGAVDDPSVVSLREVMDQRTPVTRPSQESGVPDDAKLALATAQRTLERAAAERDPVKRAMLLDEAACQLDELAIGREPASREFWILLGTLASMGESEILAAFAFDGIERYVPDYASEDAVLSLMADLNRPTVKPMVDILRKHRESAGSRGSMDYVPALIELAVHALEAPASQRTTKWYPQRSVSYRELYLNRVRAGDSEGAARVLPGDAHLRIYVRAAAAPANPGKPELADWVWLGRAVGTDRSRLEDVVRYCLLENVVGTELYLLLWELAGQTKGSPIGLVPNARVGHDLFSNAEIARTAETLIDASLAEYQDSANAVLSATDTDRLLKLSWQFHLLSKGDALPDDLKIASRRCSTELVSAAQALYRQPADDNNELFFQPIINMMGLRTTSVREVPEGIGDYLERRYKDILQVRGEPGRFLAHNPATVLCRLEPSKSAEIATEFLADSYATGWIEFAEACMRAGLRDWVAKEFVHRIRNKLTRRSKQSQDAGFGANWSSYEITSLAELSMYSGERATAAELLDEVHAHITPDDLESLFALALQLGYLDIADKCARLSNDPHVIPSHVPSGHIDTTELHVYLLGFDEILLHARRVDDYRVWAAGCEMLARGIDDGAGLDPVSDVQERRKRARVVYELIRERAPTLAYWPREAVQRTQLAHNRPIAHLLASKQLSVAYIDWIESASERAVDGFLEVIGDQP